MRFCLNGFVARTIFNISPTSVFRDRCVCVSRGSLGETFIDFFDVYTYLQMSFTFVMPCLLKQNFIMASQTSVLI